MTEHRDISARIKKRRGSKVMRLQVQSDGAVVLTVPWRMSLHSAREFLATKYDWIVAARKRMELLPPRLLTQGGEDEYWATKERARAHITERVSLYAKHYGVTYQSLSIRNQRSRFGSCSARGHLSFNYRLIFLPPSLFDYVVVHEVCHLRELNHSPRFWALVAETIPDYREKKHELQAFSR
jgi:predicted metal-dependent hydrolase